jgi:polar amino acid transport system substrate-binding protein
MIKKSTDHFVLSRDGDLPRISANRQRIEQVLINLIQNACQALPDRDKGISISTRYCPEKYAVVIVVKDEGTGIEEHDLTRLGNPFFTTKRGHGGTGLGLWISFNIVREHGGTLEFHSVPGKGTRAELTLPISQGQ